MNRRPREGIAMIQEDMLISAMYRMMEADVERMWLRHPPDVIAGYLSREWGEPISPKLVCSMWQRIKRKSK